MRQTGDSEGQRTHAVVIGSGIAGLLAAHVLAQHFELVTVVERGGDGNSNVTSAPGRATRPLILLARGVAILDSLMPTLRQDLEGAGVVAFNQGLHVEWFVLERWRPRYRSSVETLSASYGLVAGMLRRFVAGAGNVRFLSSSGVTGLLAEDEGEQVTGVHLGEGANGATLEASLVVDASGAGSVAPEWLRAIGCTPPPKTVMATGTSYVSRLFRRPAGMRPMQQMIVIQPDPDRHARGAILLPLEGDRVHVTLIGRGRTPLPPTRRDFSTSWTRLPPPVSPSAFAMRRPSRRWSRVAIRRVVSAIMSACPIARRTSLPLATPPAG